LLPRRLVSHVNRVAALEIRDPLLLVVHVKTDDSPPWGVERRHRAIAA
jgi:hypothetical protein